MDKDIKEGLIYETLNLIDLGSCDKRKCQEEERKRVQERLFNKKGPKDRKEEEAAISSYMEHLASHEKKHMRGFKLIYPNGNEEKYRKFFEQSASLFGETAASRARQECARNQREEIEAKQKQLEGVKNAPKPKLPPKALKPESPGHEKAEKMNKPLMTLYDKYKKPPVPSPASSQPPSLQEQEPSSAQPQRITDDEELDRLSLMLQRDNLVRSTGIAEQLYSLLDTANTSPTVLRPPAPTHLLPVTRPLMFMAETNQCPPKMLPSIYTVEQDLAKATGLMNIDKSQVNYFPKLNKKRRPNEFRINCDISHNFVADNSSSFRSNSAGRKNLHGMWPVKSQSDQNVCERLMKQDFLLTPHLINPGIPNTLEAQDPAASSSASSQLRLISHPASISQRPDLSTVGRNASFSSGDNVKLNRTHRIREATNSIKVKQMVLQSKSQSSL